MHHLKRLMLTAGLALAAFVPAEAQVSWAVRNGPLPARTLNAAAWMQSQYIVVGDSGLIMTSTSGSAWVVRTTPVAGALLAVASNGETAVAVGASGVIRTSSDGVTWTSRPSASGSLYTVTWAGDRFLAAGASGTILTSTNGATWSSHTSGVAGTLRAATWTGTHMIVVGDGGTILVSADKGATWATRTSGTNQAFYGVHASEGAVVAVGNSGVIRYSTDLTSWQTRTSSATGYLSAVTRASGQWIAAGVGGMVITSPDGQTWTSRLSTSGTTQVLNGLASGGVGVLAVGGASTLRLSNDGASWANPVVTVPGLNGVAWSASTGFVAVGDAGSILTSQTGASWTPQTSGVNVVLNGVTWAGNKLIAVGASGTVLTSPDGAVWTPQTTPPNTPVLYSAAHNGTIAVVVGGGGTILSSDNGVTWTARPSAGITTNLLSVRWTGSAFIAVGAGGAILTSTNGTSWTGSSSGIVTGLYSSAAIGNVAVAVGASAVALTSTASGAVWTSRTTGASGTLYSVAANGTAFVATGGSGQIRTSLDGVTWNAQATGTTSALYGVAASDQAFVAVGAAGTILTAPSLALPTVPTLTSPAQDAQGVSIYPALTWGAVSGASSYRVQISTDVNFSTVTITDSVTSPGWNATALAGNTTYYWRVSARNGLGSSAYSAARRFVTGAAPTTPPPVPTPLTPAQFAANVAIPVSFTWTASSGAAFYRIQVSATPDFATTLADDSTLTGTSFSLSTLTGGATYYWRVRAKNALGSSAWSELFGFSTVLVAPAVPTPLTPAQFAENVSRNPAMSWSASANATTYHLQVSLNSSFSSFVFQDSGLTATNRTIGMLASTTDYFWRVRAKNASGTSAFSGTQRFTTGTTSALRYAYGFGHPTLQRESLRLSLSRPERVTLRFLGLDGRRLAPALDARREAGEHVLSLPEALRGQVYLLELRVGAEKAMFKVHP